MLLAGGVGRDVGGSCAGFDVAFLNEPGFHFFTAHIGEYLAVDFERRLQGLAAPGHHLLIVLGIVDNVTVVKRKIVFPEHGAYAIAPATTRFHPGNNSRFAHRV